MHDKDNMPDSDKSPVDPTDVVMSLRARLHEASLDEIMDRLRDAVGELPTVGEIPSVREVPGDPDEALSLPVLMDRVREEVERRRLADVEDMPLEVTPSDRKHDPFPRWQSRASTLPIKRAYDLPELLQFSDAEFVDTAYRVLLHRPVDPASREQYMAVIRNGYMSKVEVLGRIRFSREGKQCGVHVEGLLRPYLIHRWKRFPVLGTFLALASALIRLPRLSNRLQAIEQAAARETQALGEFLNRSIGVMEQRYQAETDDLRAVQGELHKMSIARQQELKAAVIRIETLKDRLEAERRVLRSIDEGHQQLEDEARARFAQLEAMTTKLNNDVNAVNEHGERARQNILERISSLDRSNESLNAEFEKFRDARNKAAQDVKRHLESVDKAMSSLMEDIRENRKARESALNDVIERLDELDSVTSDLDEKFRDERHTRSESLEQLMERLATVDADSKSLSEEFREYQSMRSKVLREFAERLEALDTDTETVGQRLRAVREDHEKAVGELAERLKAVDDIAAELNESMQSRTTEYELQHQEVMDRLGAHDSILEAIKTDDEKIAEFNQSMESYREELEKRHHEIVNHLSAHDSMIDAVKKGDAQTRRSGLEVQRQLMKLLDSSSPSVERVQGNDGAGAGGNGDQVLAPAYVDFEDTFRGTHDDIKARVGEYLKTFTAHGIQASAGLVLDLGCGRGEWLDVLDENGFTCRGVDLNPVMLEDLRNRGFDVVESDALEYLRALETNSVAVITSMHLVEHVPHNTLIRMLDECFRVLKPKGLLILETPNPENLTVGACWFYLDPTHRNPIPPGLLQWTVSARGFEQTEIERLSEHRMQPDLPFVADDVPAAHQINKLITWFTAPPDYAVIAQKPAAKTKARNGASTISAEKAKVPSQAGKRAKKKKSVKKGKSAKDA